VTQLSKVTKPRLTDEEVAEQAAMWTVELSADEPICKKSLLAEFEQWQQADNRHKKSAVEMQGFIQSIGSVDSVNAIDSANTAQAKKKRPRFARNVISSVLVGSHSSMLASTLKGATFSLLLTLAALLGINQFPPAIMMADISTSAGEWQSHTLDDGSQISLNSNSAIDIRFTNNTRELILLAGQVKVTVSKDAQRPFIVSTEHGSIEALGTEFIVSHQDASTNLAMLESKTLVKTAQQLQTTISQGLVVSAGFSVKITEDKLGVLQKISPTSLAKSWQKKLLVVQNKSLADVLNEINRHRTGNIFYDNEQVQHLRVSAVLPLNDTEQALTLLMANYPQLKMRMLTPYAVFIGEK